MCGSIRESQKGCYDVLHGKEIREEKRTLKLNLRMKKEKGKSRQGLFTAGLWVKKSWQVRQSQKNEPDCVYSNSK